MNGSTIPLDHDRLQRSAALPPELLRKGRFEKGTRTVSTLGGHQRPQQRGGGGAIDKLATYDDAGRDVQRWLAAASATKRPARAPLKRVVANDQ